MAEEDWVDIGIGQQANTDDSWVDIAYSPDDWTVGGLLKNVANAGIRTAAEAPAFTGDVLREAILGPDPQVQDGDIVSGRNPLMFTSFVNEQLNKVLLL